MAASSRASARRCYEHAVYDDSGQLLTGSFMDYCMPRADDMPAMAVSTLEVPCTTNPLGIKGCGEAGAVGSPPAVINAVVDALSDARRQRHRHAGDAPEGLAADPVHSQAAAAE